MSALGPESIPTSADPRSHRPTKKRALTPVSAQAANVDALFAKPDQNIRIPDGTVATSRAAPPEIVSNVQGSSAGAGSGEFHVYKASRRREYERLREMDESIKREKGQQEFDQLKKERDQKDDERTRKNREKREKMKARKAKKGKGSAPGAGAGNKPTVESPAGEPTTKDAVKDAKDGDDTTQNDKNKDDYEPTTAEPVGLVIHDDD